MPDALGHLSLSGPQRVHLNFGSPLRSPVIAEITGLGSGNGQDHGRGCSSRTALGFSELVSQTPIFPTSNPLGSKAPGKGILPLELWSCFQTRPCPLLVILGTGWRDHKLGVRGTATPHLTTCSQTCPFLGVTAPSYLYSAQSSLVLSHITIPISL